MAVTCIHSLTPISQLPLAHSDAKRTTACPFHFDRGSQKKHRPTVRRQAVCFDISTSVCAVRESDVPKLHALPEGLCPSPPWPERWSACHKALAVENTGDREAPFACYRQKQPRVFLLGTGLMPSVQCLHLTRNLKSGSITPCRPASMVKLNYRRSLFLT